MSISAQNDSFRFPLALCLFCLDPLLLRLCLFIPLLDLLLSEMGDLFVPNLIEAQGEPQCQGKCGRDVFVLVHFGPASHHLIQLLHRQWLLTDVVVPFLKHPGVVGHVHKLVDIAW